MCFHVLFAIEHFVWQCNYLDLPKGAKFFLKGVSSRSLKGFQDGTPWKVRVQASGASYVFLEARIPDRLRAACAADAAEKADASLGPVAQQVLQACEKALPGAEEPLPVS